MTSIHVPHDADAAVLIGNGVRRYGVLAAINGQVRVLPLSDEWQTELANIAQNMHDDPQEDAATFLRNLPIRLRWIQWAKPVKPGETVSSGA